MEMAAESWLPLLWQHCVGFGLQRMMLYLHKKRCSFFQICIIYTFKFFNGCLCKEQCFLNLRITKSSVTRNINIIQEKNYNDQSNACYCWKKYQCFCNASYFEIMKNLLKGLRGLQPEIKSLTGHSMYTTS